MAFEDAITERSFSGNKAVTRGTFTNGGADEGGDIDTGLHRCEFIKLQHSGSSVVASAPVVNETLPVDGSAVTIVTTAGADGYWEAIGDMHN
jgi:hypothetical protein